MEGMTDNCHLIIDRTAELRLPAIYQWPETAEEGGLLGYGPRFVGIFRQRARMVAKIFRFDPTCPPTSTNR
jgi:putative ABC transport system substrate-binding protein